MIIGLVSVSDRASAGVYKDEGIPSLKEWLASAIASPAWRDETRLIADEQPVIEQTLRRLVDETGCHLVLTTGGTGLSPRDVTPEATRAVLEREAPGLVERVRVSTLDAFPRAALSRALAGSRH
ncbi:MAG TPA: molybdopterin-binding protein, partial [Burkholderiales bacterium]|nr:molybdopterin-binding protein [Burkholderiales bacterium]